MINFWGIDWSIAVHANSTDVVTNFSGVVNFIQASTIKVIASFPLYGRGGRET